MTEDALPPGRRTPQVTGRTQSVADSMQADPVSMIGRFLGWARLAWIAAVIVAGALGTGVGLLIGEGRARELFAAQYADHERRLVTHEGVLRERRAELDATAKEELESREVERRDRARVLERIEALSARMSGVEGSLGTIKDLLRTRGGGR